MNVRRAITGPVGAIARLGTSHLLLGAGAGTAAAVAVLIGLSVAEASRTPSKEGWRQHHEACHRLPEELYHRDRFRAIRGRVTDDDGQPIAGASVRCAKLESLVEFARAGIASPSSWSIPIEAETTTDERGQYDFPHLPVGGRTFFYSAPGRHLAPAIKDLVVVQDGLGAQLNVTLAKPATLRVKVQEPRKPSLVRKGADRWYHQRARQPALTRLVLIPHRWWPTLPAADLRQSDLPPRPTGERVPEGRVRGGPQAAQRAIEAEFRNLGGPLRKGLIAAAGPDEVTPLRIVGRYDLDQSAEAIITGATINATLVDLPEAASIESWHHGPVRASHRLFYAAMSPIALFWRSVGDDQPLWLDLPSQSLQAPPLIPSALTGQDVLRGFAPHPFLPVLVESRTGGSWLTWTSDASEYEVCGLPAGAYRVRALDLFGRVTFASGATVRDGTSVEPARLWTKLDLDEPDSRQVMGFVRWENGVPAAKTAVFMQNRFSFRKYVRRIETDEQGFFRFLDVPGDEPYFLFALPPGETDAMRNFEYFGMAPAQRESWRALELHPHRVTGDLPDAVLSTRRPVAGTALDQSSSSASADTTLQLVRLEDRTERVLWTFRAETSGKLVVANVPHGRYRVQVSQKDGRTAFRSLAFDIGDGRIETSVRWPSP